MSEKHAAKPLSSDEVSQAVVLMRPSVDSVGEVAGVLLEQTRGAAPDTFAEQAAHFLETMNELVLNWMSEGKHDELRGLADAFRQVLAKCASTPLLLSKMPQHDHLTVRLDVVIRQIAQLLRGDSLAKHMGLLSGSRRKSYRDLLLNLYDHSAPIIRRQAREFGPPGMSREAGEKAVDRMTEMGLLTKQKAGAKTVQVELTWAGRRAAQMWLDTLGLGHDRSIADAIEPDQVQPEENTLELLRGERMTWNLSAVGLTPFDSADILAINGE